jgi:hypothetical protein
MLMARYPELMDVVMQEQMEVRSRNLYAEGTKIVVEGTKTTATPDKR